MPNEDTRNFFSQIYWLGGSSCTGKSTLSTMVAERFGWTVYHADEFFEAHRLRSNASEHPHFDRVSRLWGDALWLRDVGEMVSDELRFLEDEFKMVIEDLQRLHGETGKTILFEGAGALPHLVKPLLPARHHALWLIPTEAHQRFHYAQRHWIREIINATSNPEQAFENWMARDARFARWLEQQAQAHDLAWLRVDGTHSLEETAEIIAGHFQRTREYSKEN
jgi:2-phosphoglycerate kinase